MKTLDGRAPVGGVFPLLYAPFIIQGLSNHTGDIAVQDIKNELGGGGNKTAENPQMSSFVSAAWRGAAGRKGLHAVPCPVFAEPGHAPLQIQIRSAIPVRRTLSI